MNLLVFALSVVGFGAFLLLDNPPVTQRPLLRHATSMVGSLALAVAMWWAADSGDVLDFPRWTTGLGWALAIFGLFLLVYSVFIEIPLTLRHHTGPGPALVQSGTYALCRHPGVLWLVLLLVGVLLIVKRTGFVPLMVLWIILDTVVVTVQDRIVFPRQFPGYDQYQRRTPFLVPTPASLATFIGRNAHATSTSEDK